MGTSRGIKRPANNNNNNNDPSTMMTGEDGGDGGGGGTSNNNNNNNNDAGGVTSTSTSGSGRKKDKKKNRKGKKQKNSGSGTTGKDKINNNSNNNNNNNNNNTNKDGSSSLETTATVEGTEMKQVLSTFSKLEQSRFEAFRKASFPGDAIGTYVAHCLIHEQHRSISTGDIDKSTSSERGGNEEAATAVATNTSTASIVSNSTRLRYLRPTTTTAATSKRRKQKPILSDVVATGQSGDITVVVSTLAKAYAQRLVLAARKYSIERRRNKQHKISVHDENSNHDDDDDDDDEEEEEEEDIAISPEDILKAYADREVRGLDPGFFLQATGTKNNSGSSNSGCTNVNLLLTENDQRYTLNRSVVLSAQDDYYNNMENENDNDSNNDNDNDNDNDNMEIDVDDEHNNDNVDTITDNNDVAEKDKGGNNEKRNNSNDDDDDDDDDDPVDESVKLFSLLVNQINARQNGGITVTALSSSDYDNSIGIGSDIIADSNKSNKLDGNKNELEKEGVIVNENNNDKKKGISNINTDNNVTATELVAVPIDTSSDGTTTTNATTTINNDSTEDATTTLATTNTTTIDTKSEDDNA